MANPYLLSSSGPGLTVSSSASNATAAVGDTISIAVGTTTKLAGGSTASLTVGPTTSINLGTTISFAASQTVSFSVSKAKKIYASDKTETAENTTNSATGSYVIQGGTIPNAANVARVSRKTEIALSLTAAAISLGATIGGSIYGLMNPPITISNSPNAPSNAKYSDTETKSFSGFEILITAFVVTVVQLLSVKWLFNNITPSPVAKLTLDDNGFTTTVSRDATSSNANISINPTGVLPSISLKTSDVQNVEKYSEILLGESEISITTRDGASPLLYLNNSISNGVIGLSNSSVLPVGTLIINGDETLMSRTEGMTGISVGEGQNSSNVEIQEESIVISSSEGGETGSILVKPSGVSIGAGASAAVFNSEGMTLGNVKITPSQISLGGAITIMANSVGGVSPAISAAQEAIASLNAKYQTSMSEIQAKLNATSSENKLLSKEVAALRAKVQELMLM